MNVYKWVVDRKFNRYKIFSNYTFNEVRNKFLVYSNDIEYTYPKILTPSNILFGKIYVLPNKNNEKNETRFDYYEDDNFYIFNTCLNRHKKSMRVEMDEDCNEDEFNKKIKIYITIKPIN